ncbi:hypothetical protein Tco_0553511, partial [Tanacetum coccineum]
AVKRIFRYLKGQPKLDLWYPNDSSFDLVAYTDSDYAGASLDRKSTIGGCQFHTDKNVADLLTKAFDVRKAKKNVRLMMEKLFGMELKLILVTQNTHNLVAFLSKPAESERFEQIVDILNAQPIRYALTVNPTIYTSCIEQFWSTVKAKTINGEVQLHALVDCKKIIVTEASVRRDLQLEDEEDEAVHKELGDSLVRAATIAFSLEAEQDSGNITKTRSKATPNESSSLGTTLSGGPRCQEIIGDTIAQTRFENVSKHSNDSLLARGNTLRSDKDRLKLDELMELCTNLQKKVLDLKKTKTSQQNEIDSLKRRVKKLERKDRSRTHKLKRLYKVGLTARIKFSRDEESLDDVDNEMFDVNALNGEEVFVAGQNENVIEEVVDAAQVSTATTTATITTEEITLAQAFEALKTSKSKVKGIVFQEPEWDDIQTKIEVDHELAQRLQAEEQEELAFKRVNTFVDFRTDLVEGSSKRAGEELKQESTKK